MRGMVGVRGGTFMQVRYVDAPAQYGQFLKNREMLIGLMADELAPVMGEVGVRFMRIDGRECEVLICRKKGK